MDLKTTEFLEKIVLNRSLFNFFQSLFSLYLLDTKFPFMYT